MNDLIADINRALSFTTRVTLTPCKYASPRYFKENQFLPVEILALVQSYKHTRYKMADSGPNTSVRLHFFESAPDIKHHQFVSQFVAKAFTVFDTVFGKRTDDLDIVFADVPIKKYLPDRHAMFEARHINSGYSIIPIGDTSRKLIVVFRKDEKLKVFLHELLHIHHMHPFDTNAAFDESVAKEFKIRTGANGLNIYEGYVEFMTTVLNTCFYKHIFKNSKVSIAKELAHSKQNVEMIMRFVGKGYMNQATSVFSYIMIKHALLSNPSKVFSILNQDYSVPARPFEKLLRQELRLLYKQFKNINYRAHTRHVTLNLFDIYKTYLKISKDRDITI